MPGFPARGGLAIKSIYRSEAGKGVKQEPPTRELTGHVAGAGLNSEGALAGALSYRVSGSQAPTPGSGNPSAAQELQDVDTSEAEDQERPERKIDRRPEPPLDPREARP